MFFVNRIKLTMDKLSPYLQHGFIWSGENVILHSISTHYMALLLVCSMMLNRTLNFVTDGITTFVNNGRWYNQLLVVFWQILNQSVADEMTNVADVVATCC